MVSRRPVTRPLLAGLAASALLAILPATGGSSSGVAHAQVPTAADDPAPEGLPGDWRLVFADDFDGTTLDAGRWRTEFPWGPISTTTPRMRYRPENVVVGGGAARLIAKREATTRQGRSYRYTSGMLSTGTEYLRSPSVYGNARFAPTYGFFEMRAKMPKGRGLWPAFWLLPPDTSWPPEIDVIELYGDRPDEPTFHFHYEGRNGRHIDFGRGLQVPDDLTDGFHTYAVEWSPTAIRWFLDGVEVQSFTDARSIPDGPMYLIINLQTGVDDGTWQPSRGALPADLVVDYVRAWQRADAAEPYARQ